MLKRSLICVAGPYQVRDGERDENQHSVAGARDCGPSMGLIDTVRGVHQEQELADEIANQERI